jgi:hypothetical protein
MTTHSANIWKHFHTCLGCAEQLVSWKFAICARCESKYGHSVLEWPEWLRDLWNNEQRERRSDDRYDEHNAISIEYAENCLDFVSDGISFPISNKNNERYLNLVIVEEIFKSLPEKERTILALHTSGYTQENMAELLGCSRTSIGENFRKGLRLLEVLNL